MPHRDPEALPEGGTARQAGGLVEGFLRDAMVNGAVLLSLVTVVAGFLTSVGGWIAAGIVIGGAGIVLPWWSVGRRWSISSVWVTVLAVLVADLATLTLMWTTT